MPNRNTPSRLHRSRRERMLFGVCGGLAEYFNLDPAIVRILFVLAVFVPPLSAVSLLGYPLLALVLPEEGEEHLQGRDVIRRNLEGMRADVTSAARDVRAGITGIAKGRQPAAPTPTPDASTATAVTAAADGQAEGPTPGTTPGTTAATAEEPARPIAA